MQKISNENETTTDGSNGSIYEVDEDHTKANASIPVIVECVQSFINSYSDSQCYELKRLDADGHTLRHILYSIYHKKWQVAAEFLVRPSFQTNGVITTVSNDTGEQYRVRKAILDLMCNCNLEFPLGNNSDLDKMINLFQTVGGQEHEQELEDHDGLKILLFVAVNQKDTCTELIDMLVNIKGRDFITQTTFDYGRTVLHCACKSKHASIDIVKKLLDVGKGELVMTRIDSIILHFMLCVNHQIHQQLTLLKC
jgi:hypothetical protein